MRFVVESFAFETNLSVGFVVIHAREATHEIIPHVQQVKADENKFTLLREMNPLVILKHWVQGFKSKQEGFLLL